MSPCNLVKAHFISWAATSLFCQSESKSNFNYRLAQIMTFMGVMELDQEWKGDQNSEKKVFPWNCTIISCRKVTIFHVSNYQGTIILVKNMIAWASRSLICFSEFVLSVLKAVSTLPANMEIKVNMKIIESTFSSFTFYKTKHCTIFQKTFFFLRHPVYKFSTVFM